MRSRAMPWASKPSVWRSGTRVSTRAMSRRFRREVAAAGLPAGPPPGGPVTEADLDALPEPARRWLRAAGVVGRPRDWSFRARLRMRFRAAPGARWQRVEALQYTSGWPEVARIFHSACGSAASRGRAATPTCAAPGASSSARSTS